MNKILLALLVPITIVGCASLFSRETQEVKVNIVGAQPQNVSSMSCTLQNGRGSWHAPVGESVVIRRDGEPLIVSCYDKDNNLVAKGVAKPYYNTTNLWNIPLTLIPAAGIAGWVLDGTNGTSNEYPENVVVH